MLNFIMPVDPSTLYNSICNSILEAFLVNILYVEFNEGTLINKRKLKILLKINARLSVFMGAQSYIIDSFHFNQP